MTLSLDLLRKVSIYEEPNGSYQVDRAVDNPGDFLDFPFVEGTYEASGMEESLNPMPGKIYADGDVLQVRGRRTSTATLTTTLHSHGLDLDGDASPPTASTWALARVLKAVMGGLQNTTAPGAQTTVQAAGSTTVVNVTAGHGVRFAAGGVIACQTVSGSSLLELREILSISTDAISVKEAFSAAPVVGTPVRGGVTFFLTEGETETSLQLLEQGRGTDDATVYRGLQGGFSLTLPVGQLGQIAFALAGADWAKLEGDSPALSAPSYGVYEPFWLSPLAVSLPTVGSTTRTPLEAAEVTIEPQIAYAPQRSGAATQTIARMRRQASRPVVQGSFLVPYEGDDLENTRAAWEGREVRALFAQGGNIAGRACLISCPTVQIVDVQDATLPEGLRGQRVSFRGRHDAATAGTSELLRSALRLHFV